MREREEGYVNVVYDAVEDIQVGTDTPEQLRDAIIL